MQNGDNMEKVLIHVEDFTMAYTDIPVIWDMDLDIYEGSITAIIGPNGAGKSTLMKGILGLMKPISGKVSIIRRYTSRLLIYHRPPR